jgi:plasmid stabilization system protein ParE
LKLIWSPTADESLNDIEVYLARFSAGIADRWIKRIKLAAEGVCHMPRKHRRVPEVDSDSIREVIVDPYRIWFRILDADDTIQVLLVLHGAQEVPK